MNTRQIIRFLEGIWKNQSKPGEYVFISTNNPKKSRSWVDHPIKCGRELRPQIRDILTRHNPKTYDLYWCPLPFTQNKRAKEFVTRSKYLWQDLDHADPKKYPELLPTIYWESSPKRFHGLWELDKIHDLDKVENLNRDLAYHIGADKGGWDLTQVLRIPGTRNHKYKDKPKVTLRKEDGVPYKLGRLRKQVPETKMIDLTTVSKLEEGNPQKILQEWATRLPRELLQTLVQKEVPVGERSDKLWYLQNKLYEIGMSPSEIYTLIKNSAWNKYQGRHDEEERLQAEMEKVISQAIEQTIPKEDQGSKKLSEITLETGATLKIESYAEVMGKINTYPGWLVEGFWMRRSHGIVAGEPKAFKSTYVMDLALSVASGRPFLGEHKVLEPGPVIYIQNENADWIIKDKHEKMITSRGLTGKVKVSGPKKLKITFPQDLPLYFINQQGFQLNNAEHQEILEKLIEDIEPVLVIFDPLYLMFDGDVNSARELNPVLNWMLHIKNHYRTGVIAIHHYNKGGGSGTWRGGQRMLGSTTLHGWIESAWYLHRDEPEEDLDANKVEQSNLPSKVILDREFRNAGQYPKLELSVLMGGLGNPLYEVSSQVYTEGSPGTKNKTPEELVSMVDESVKTAAGDAVTMSQLEKMLGVGGKRLDEAVNAFLTQNPDYAKERINGQVVGIGRINS